VNSVRIMLPDSLFAALRKAPHEAPREIRIAASIHWYQQSVLSMAVAAETAGMSRPEFLAELARRHVDVFVVDEEDPGRELHDALSANVSQLIFLGNAGRSDPANMVSR